LFFPFYSSGIEINRKPKIGKKEDWNQTGNGKRKNDWNGIELEADIGIKICFRVNSHFKI
jgi:hypothetical protein